MKKIFFAIALTASISNAYAQTNTFPTSGNVGILTTSPTAALDVRGTIQLVNRDNAAAYWDNLKLWTQGANSFIESDGDEDGLIIRSNLGGKILLLSNVGIGTTNTQGYKLAVAGNMIAESVKVKLQTAWPDYVFTKEYKLPTLASTEQHIKDKGHLPGIPSAAEVLANGVDLGQMNAKLLQKIEELTLYLIEIKKENTEVKKRLTSIEKSLIQQK